MTDEELIAALRARITKPKEGPNMKRLQKIALIAQSLELLPCDRCQEWLTAGVNPDSDYRCDNCSNSLRTRWQEEQRRQRESLEGMFKNERESA
jgi:hypothetical protein